MSVRRSTFFPADCSGDMYEYLPLSTPERVTVAWSAAFAMPKSTTFTPPSKVTRMFCGETSRWTMPSGLPVWSVFLCA